MSAKKSSQRKRGMVLSDHGRQRLREAIHQIEVQENQGQPYLAKDLSQRVGISESTISRLWAGKFGIDPRSLEMIFRSLGLELTDADLQFPDQADCPQSAPTVTDSPPAVPYPSGPLPLDSPFYIPRPPTEEQACQEMTRPGSVVRIKAPSGFGKSSLLLRVVAQARELDYAIASLDLKQAEPAILSDVQAFLRWFCQAFALSLGQNPNLEDSWNEVLGNSLSATVFVREQILELSPTPVVLNIQELNQLFAYSTTAQSFLPLLRSWHEESRQDAVWQKLRQVVSYATDSYLPLDINQSPLNIGLPLLLPRLTNAQMITLAARYHLHLNTAELEQLQRLIGGHPALVNLAFYHLSQSNFSFEALLNSASKPGSVFYSYLQRLLVQVQDGPEQMAQLKTLVISDRPVYLEPILAYQLEATGLIQATAEGWVIGLQLYRDFLDYALFQADA